MVTVRKILQACENNKNWRVDKLTKCDDGTLEIGFTMGGGVWNWFYFYDHALTKNEQKDTYLFFRHSYSQNTGASKRGFARAWHLRDRIFANL